MDASSVYERNPWQEGDTSLSALHQAIALAQRTGHIRWESTSGEKEESTRVPREEHPSLQLIDQLTQLEKQRKQLDQLLLEVQRRVQDMDTRDLTHASILEERVREISALNTHLQSVVNEKHALISRLQKPYTGDLLRIEAPYKKDVLAVLPQIVPILSSLTSQLDNLQAVRNLSLADGQLDAVLTDISTNLASLQTGFQNLENLRGTISQLQQQQHS